MSSRDNDDSWQARTHVIRVSPVARPKTAGGDCLVIIYSRDTSQLGRRYVLEPTPTGTSLGRGQDNTIVLDSDTCSRRHARIDLVGETWYLTDERSTNGTYVNDEASTRVALRRGDHIKIGDTIFKFLAGSDVEAEFIQTIGTIMVTDGLTKAHNRRYLTEQLERELQRSRRHGRPLALVMFDLDHFKKINDTYGHLAGDYVLRETATIVRSHMAGDMVFARYGGEEFALLLPETELQKARELAEAIRGSIASHRFVFDSEQIPVTVSMGVALAAETMTNVDEFIKASDTKLYQAKSSGRNRVCA